MPEGFKPDLSKAVGYQYPDDTLECTRRDYLMYALAVGVPETELRWLYENDPDFGPLPAYPVSLMIKGESWDAVDFAERWHAGGPLPGMPEWDINKMVHGEQSIDVINPFPAEGGRFKSVKTCRGVYDKGSGMVIHTVVDLYGEKDNVHYYSMGSQMFIRGYGGWDGPKGPKTIKYTPPNRPADAVDKFETARNQALLFRLSGDFNPLHADVNLAPLVGFERPILHGLCSYGKAVHSVLRAFGNNDRLRFKSITARFAKPVLPGETVEIHMWKVEGPEPKTDGVIFIAKVGDRVVLTNGYVVLHKETPESKL
ncbi:Thioesterase/thiol ester dehydrase-isomerase [Lichtheimia hyalospora FSU 10163]|nr:Thioesterase/thiol ester dehydrase-isomerase [Lichtheimia hyalospora FSU 10163]